MAILNFCVSLVYALGLTCGTWAYVLLAKLLAVLGLGNSLSTGLAAALTIAGIILGSILLVRRRMAAGRSSPPNLILGHTLIGIGNVVTVGVTIYPMIRSVFKNEYDVTFLWYLLPILLIDVVLWGVGWQLAMPRRHA